MGIAYSYIRDAETLDVPTFVTGVRGGLVSVTGICALARPWEGLVIGVFGGLFACLLSDAMIKLKIDDPVNCVSTHAGSGVWGMIAVALFVEQEKTEGFAEEKGLFKVLLWCTCVGLVLPWVVLLRFLTWFSQEAKHEFIETMKNALSMKISSEGKIRFKWRGQLRSFLLFRTMILSLQQNFLTGFQTFILPQFRTMDSFFLAGWKLATSWCSVTSMSVNSRLGSSDNSYHVLRDRKDSRDTPYTGGRTSGL